MGWSLPLLMATKILNANAIINDVETIKQLSVINNLFSEKQFLISWNFIGVGWTKNIFKGGKESIKLTGAYHRQPF